MGSEHLYTAELFVQAEVYSHGADRTTIPSPHELGVTRGYWELRRTPNDAAGLPDGVRAVVEFPAESLTDAEDTALEAGRRVALFTSLAGGVPLRAPRLIRVAETTPGGHLQAQWDYYYDDHPVGFAPLSIYDLATLSALTFKLSPADQWRVELATRWHGIAAGSTSSVDRFLAAWFAIEAVSPILDAKWHPVPRASCAVCGTIAGAKRNRSIAGAEHLLHRIVPELLDTISFTSIHNLRSTVVHALDDYSALNETMDLVAADMVLCSGSAILSALPASHLLSAVAPRDRAEHPESRAGLVSTIALRTHSPFLGGWISVERVLLIDRTWTAPGGAPNRGTQPAFRYDIKIPREVGQESDSLFTKTLVHFVDHPDGVEVRVPSAGESFAQWRPKTPSAALLRGWKTLDRDGFVVGDFSEVLPFRSRRRTAAPK